MTAPLLHHVHLRAFDAERLQDVLRGGRADHLLLAPHAADAEMWHWQSDDVSVDRGRYGFATAVVAQFRPGFLGIGRSDDAAKRTYVNGIEVGAPHLQLYPEGTEISYRAAAGTTWTAIQLRREALQQRAEERLGRALRLPDRFVENVAPDAGGLAELVRTLDSLLATSRDADDSGDEPALLRELVVDAAVDAIDRSAARDLDRRRARSLHARAAVVREAQRLMLGRSGRFSSAAVCAAVGVPERTLQLYFRQLFGRSPSSWHRLARLHGARRLLGNGHRSTSVTEVALRCGFDQLGRFAVEYRRHFGEKPSDTLRRAPRRFS